MKRLLTATICAVGIALSLLPLWDGSRGAAQSAFQGVSIPDAHPRLWWTPDRLVRARAWYQKNPFTPRPDDPLGIATRCVLTGESSYCQAAVTYAMGQMCSNAACNSSDPNYGVASDDARWFGENIALIYDWCHRYFTQSQRDTLISRWNGYYNNIRLRSWGGPKMFQSNYNWGYMRNDIEWGIATWGENPQAATHLQYGLETRWQNNIAPHLRADGRGGVFQEGSAYGSAIGDYSNVPFGSAALLGRDVYRETNFFREAVLYMVYATLPAPTYNKNNGGTFWEMFPFADDERFFDGGMPARANYGGFMQVMADYWRDVPIGQYARRWLNMVNGARANHIRAIDRGGSERDFGSLPLDYFASGARFAYARNRWGGQATVLNLQLGVTADEGHRHNDVGTWQIWRNGRWLSRETTGYSQNIVGFTGSPVDANNAAAHNSLMIGSRGPAPSYQSGKTVVSRLESKPDYLYAAVDLTPSYRATHPAVDNADAAHVEREFLFLRGLEALVIFDRVESTTASVSKTFLAHFETNPTVDQAGRVVTAVNGDQALRVTTLVPANPTYRPVVNEGPPVGQYRLEVETSGAAQSYFLHVLQAKGASEANVAASVREDPASYTLTLTHPTRGVATVTLQKGRASSGGSITVGSQTSDLTTSVANVAVDDNGATWTGGRLPSAPSGLRVTP